ncbi:TIR domain-containing protein [Actinomadura rayongensis]|uniref:TIR domain-containing protein n=1 Tax=Actinomadura rayongensis TaxID=1429076 RepID=A0A6I4W4C5_9ACTN|nr:TIR domain-containing protein [Actinomadura rayongensis]MXQ65037.1 TIR domain-containing protein [Actinomadura rayongensis]
MTDVYLAYGRGDAAWTRELWNRLDRHGLRVFFDELVPPGATVVHTLEQAVRDTSAGIAVFGPGAQNDGWALTEYAALLRSCAEKGLPFVPVTYGGATIPPFARDWVWMDFGDPDAFDARAAELAHALGGHGARGDGVPERHVLTEPSRPLTEPARRSVVVCYAPADAEYGRRLVERVGAAGLPVWSVRSLRPGDRHVWTIRRQLRHATVVVVVMSPAAQDSEDVTRMILEGQWHERLFFPVLLDGDRHYLLANLWWADARTGGALDGTALAQLRRLHEAALTGRPVAPADVLPEPSAVIPSMHVPASVSLERLRAALAERETEHADLLTTSLLLEAADRLETGWLRRRDGAALPTALLAGVDALWSAATGGRMGFTAQRSRAPVAGERHADFLALSTGLGWRATADDAVPAYRAFTARAAGRPGFFPTLRNPRSERHMDWYDQWTRTVLTVHARLRDHGARS